MFAINLIYCVDAINSNSTNFHYIVLGKKTTLMVYLWETHETPKVIKIWTHVILYEEMGMVVSAVCKGVVVTENQDLKQWGGNQNLARARMFQRIRIVCSCTADNHIALDIFKLD